MQNSADVGKSLQEVEEKRQGKSVKVKMIFLLDKSICESEKRLEGKKGWLAVNGSRLLATLKPWIFLKAEENQ